MELWKTYKKNFVKGTVVSIVFHAALLIAIATATFTLMVPEGNVSSGPMEMTAIPHGSDTPVEIIEKIPTELPKKKSKIKEDVIAVKKAEAKKPKAQSLPKTLPAKKVSEAKAKPVEEIPEGVDVKAKNEDSSPKEMDKPVALEPVQESAESKESYAKEEADAAAQEPVPPSKGIPESQSEATEEQMGGSGDVMSESELTAAAGNPKPEYPLMSRFRHEEGTVVLRFVVGPDGKVTKVWVYRSSGFPRLDESAAKAQSQWRYQAGRTGVVQKNVVFSLKGSATILPPKRK